MTTIQKTFVPSQVTLGQLPGVVLEAEIMKEPMLYRATPEFAYGSGGSLLTQALDVASEHMRVPTLPEGYHNLIDTKVIMLMPGHSPAIGGWHCDGYPRPTGQPDVTKDDPYVRHCTVAVSSTTEGLCPTEFTIEPISLEIDPEHVWASVNKGLDEIEPFHYRIQSGQVEAFSQSTLHRVTLATQPGWRWFFRWSILPFKPNNEYRKQVQVYADLSRGW